MSNNLPFLFPENLADRGRDEGNAAHPTGVVKVSHAKLFHVLTMMTWLIDFIQFSHFPYIPKIMEAGLSK